jgi:hypothetical protein
MRVSIKQRTEGSRHLIDFEIEFSEEEKRIITVRALERVEVDLSPGYLASSVPWFSSWIPRAAFAVSPMLFLFGCTTSCVTSISGTAGPGGFMILLAIAGFAFAMYGRFAYSQVSQSVSVRSIRESPTVTVLTEATEAHEIQDVIAQRLAGLKQTLEDMAVTTTRVIEL